MHCLVKNLISLLQNHVLIHNYCQKVLSTILQCLLEELLQLWPSVLKLLLVIQLVKLWWFLKNNLFHVQPSKLPYCSGSLYGCQKHSHKNQISKAMCSGVKKFSVLALLHDWSPQFFLGTYLCMAKQGQKVGIMSKFLLTSSHQTKNSFVCKNHISKLVFPSPCKTAIGSDTKYMLITIYALTQI